ncbi:MAG: hypothetical protein WEA80_05010 [Gemmatimonadaceae bacterium]
MQEPTAVSAASLVREHRSRILAALATVVLIATAAFAGHSWSLILGLGPAIIGAMAATLQSDAVNRWVDSRQGLFQRVSAWSDSRSNKVAKYFAQPAGGGSAWLWTRTRNIPDPSARSGVRLAVALYFWAAMVALLAAVAYVVVAALLLILIIGLISWVMSMGSSSSSDDSTNTSRSSHQDDDLLSAAGRRGQRFYRKEGVFSESEAGRIDADGRIYKKTGMFSEDEVARVDGSGHTHEKTGMFSEEERHRVDGDGRIFKKTGMFSEEEMGHVSQDGSIFKKTGMFSEEEIGRVEDA